MEAHVRLRDHRVMRVGFAGGALQRVVRGDGFVLLQRPDLTGFNFCDIGSQSWRRLVTFRSSRLLRLGQGLEGRRIGWRVCLRLLRLESGGVSRPLDAPTSLRSDRSVSGASHSGRGDYR